LMSRSESNTLATYRFRYDVVTGSTLPLRYQAAASVGQARRAGVVQWQNVSFPS
jgi:hypothetical protein